MPIAVSPSDKTLPLRILHLEDSPADAALIAWTLRMAGIQCRITRVESEADFADGLRLNNIDLVFSDSSAAGFSGISALQMVQASNVDIPFVFVSGCTSTEMRAEALRLGALDWIAKDHRIQLVFLVQRIWENKQNSAGS